MVGDGRDELAFKALGDPDALERRGVDGLHVGLLVGCVRVELDVELAVAVGVGFVPNWLVPASFSEVAVTVPVFGSMA